jgi:hypothetical protein
MITSIFKYSIGDLIKPQTNSIHALIGIFIFDKESNNCIRDSQYYLKYDTRFPYQIPGKSVEDHPI